MIYYIHMVEVEEVPYSPSQWSNRAIDVDADGNPIDKEHGQTFDSIDKFSHSQFKRGEPIRQDLKAQREEQEEQEAEPSPDFGQFDQRKTAG